MNIFQLERPITSIKPETVFEVFGYPISNTTFLIFLIAVVIILFSFFKVRKFTLKPGNTQSLFEMFYEGAWGLVNQVTQNKNITERVFPITATLLVYLGISNLVASYVPGLTSITYDGVSIFRTPTSDFNTTFGLALGAVVLTHIVSIKDWGIFNHFGKFFQIKEVYQGFKKSPGEGGMALVGFFVGLLDIVGEFAKIISLSLRLFGNLYAGEVLMIVIFGGLAYLLPALWMAMSTLSGVVQATVFGLLFTAYYTLSAKPVEDKK